MRYDNLRVHLERSWVTLGWNAYILSNTRPGTTTLWRWDGNEWVGDDHAEGTVAVDRPTSSSSPYSISFPDDIMEGIVAAAIDKMPADGSMANHLKDAQNVRDRLLTMIEARGIR